MVKKFFALFSVRELLFLNKYIQLKTKNIMFWNINKKELFREALISSAIQIYSKYLQYANSSGNWNLAERNKFFLVKKILEKNEIPKITFSRKNEVSRKNQIFLHKGYKCDEISYKKLQTFQNFISKLTRLFSYIVLTATESDPINKPPMTIPNPAPPKPRVLL